MIGILLSAMTLGCIDMPFGGSVYDGMETNQTFDVYDFYKYSGNYTNNTPTHYVINFGNNESYYTMNTYEDNAILNMNYNEYATNMTIMYNYENDGASYWTITTNNEETINTAFANDNQSYRIYP